MAMHDDTAAACAQETGHLVRGFIALYHCDFQREPTCSRSLNISHELPYVAGILTGHLIVKSYITFSCVRVGGYSDGYTMEVAFAGCDCKSASAPVPTAAICRRRIQHLQRSRRCHWVP